MRSSRSVGVVAAALLSAATLVATGGMASAGATWTISPVLGGLNGPRGVAFDAEGSVYVAEAGTYSNIAPGSFGVSHTGAVRKFTVSDGRLSRSWSTFFDSVHDSTNGGPEVLGPAGVSAMGNGCMKNSNGVREGCQVLVIVSLSRDGVNAVTPGLTFSQVGHLYRLDGATGAPTDKSDVGDQQYAWAAQHASLWKEFPDSNPYGVLVTKDPTTEAVRTYVVDAGSNTLSEVMPDGTNRIIAFVPNDPVRDSTPTCVAQGPDGALYVGTLDLVANLFVFGPGQSHVYRVDPNTSESYLTAAHVWASGLTTVTACTFDRSGNFWGTEMFQPTAGPPGDLVRIPFANPAAVQHIGAGSLPVPGGIAQGPDGAMYVTIGSANVAPNSGAVVKVTTTG